MKEYTEREKLLNRLKKEVGQLDYKFDGPVLDEAAELVTEEARASHDVHLWISPSTTSLMRNLLEYEPSDENIRRVRAALRLINKKQITPLERKLCRPTRVKPKTGYLQAKALTLAVSIARSDIIRHLLETGEQLKVDKQLL